MENMTLSDIAAVTKGEDHGHDDFGGGMSWVLVILFLLVFGGMFGNRNNSIETNSSTYEILQGQQFQSLDNKIDRIGNGIADATFALNNAVTSEGRAMQMQLADCCCSNKEAIAQVRYDMANFANATQTAIHAEGEATRAMIQQNKIESLQSQVNQLQMAQQLCGVVRYPTPAYLASGNPYGGCGCN